MAGHRNGDHQGIRLSALESYQTTRNLWKTDFGDYTVAGGLLHLLAGTNDK
jgi:hypothetical protein